MRFSPIKRTAETVVAPSPIPQTQDPIPHPPSPTPSLTLLPGLHTKRQCPIWTAQLTDRVERAEFQRIHAIARKHGGYWSSFGPVAAHGFIFFDEQSAVTFTIAAGAGVDGSKLIVDRPDSGVDGSKLIVDRPDPPQDAIPQTPSPIPMPAWRARLLRRSA